jgi:hypothetical protein
MNAPRLLRTVIGWPVETQRASRRNALVASTALTALRKEHEEVEDFLAARRLAPQQAQDSPHSHRDVI